jgi:hypothetical protein
MADGTDDRVWCGVRLGAPAVRALNTSGIHDLTELATRHRDEVGAMHGMGPKGLHLLDEALISAGLGWMS